MSLGPVLLVILILALIGVIPVWPHSRDWGPAPGGALAVVAVIVLLLWLSGRL